MNINMKPDVSYLFSNMSSSRSNSSMGNLNFLSDYASIKNGSYGKLLKAYYAKEDNDVSDSSTSKLPKPSSLSPDSAKTLTAIDSAADKLKKSADSLLNKGKDSLFQEKEVKIKNEDGTTTTTKEYDTEAIYKAVSEFVTNYNSLVGAAAKSDFSSITKATANMTNITSLYSKTLEKVGITVGEEGKLSLDKNALEAADISTLKSVFNTSPSLTHSISTQSSYIDYAAGREALKANTYNQTGSYGNNYSTGNLINSLF